LCVRGLPPLLAHAALAYPNGQLIPDSGPPLAEIAIGLDAARAELDEFARGIHPPALVEGGLADRVEALGGPLRLDSPPGRGTPLSVELPLPEPTGTGIGLGAPHRRRALPGGGQRLLK
jgi:hypothetical protein